MDKEWFDLQESGKGKIVCINQKWEYHDYIVGVNDVKFKKHLKDNNLQYVLFLPRNKKQVDEVIELIKQL